MSDTIRKQQVIDVVDKWFHMHGHADGEGKDIPVDELKYMIRCLHPVETPPVEIKYTKDDCGMYLKQIGKELAQVNKNLSKIGGRV